MARAAIVNWDRMYASAIGDSPRPVSRRKSPIPKASRNVPFAAAIESIRCSPRAVSTSATTGTPGSRRAVSFTWSVDSTIASTTPARPPSATGPPRCAGRAAASASTSCSHHREP